MPHPTQTTTPPQPGRALATLRQSAGLTPDALAAALGWTLQAVIRAEQGQDLRVSQAVALAHALGVGVSEVALAADADRRAR